MPNSIALLLALAVLLGQTSLAQDEPLSQEELSRRLAMLEMKGARPQEEVFAELDFLETALLAPTFRAEVRRFRGDCKRKGGLLSEAMAAYQSVASDPSAAAYQRLDARRSVGEVYWAQGDLAEAAAYFKNLKESVSSMQSVGSETHLAALLGWIGIAAAHHHAAILGAVGRGDDAILAYEDAIALNTPPQPEAMRRGFTNARASVNQATISETMGLLESAASYLRKARKYDPGFFAPYIDFKLLQFANLVPGSVERTDVLKRILETYPDDAWCVVIRVTLYYELGTAGEVGEARTHLIRAIETPPADSGAYGGVPTMFEAEAWFAYLDLTMAERNYAEAERAVRMMLERHPEDPRTKVVKEQYIPELANFRALGETEAAGPRSVIGERDVSRRSALVPFAVANLAAVLVLVLWVRVIRRDRRREVHA